MDIGKIGTANYARYQNNTSAPKAGEKSFCNAISNAVGASSDLVLHGITGEKNENGDTVVGAWADAIAGTSVTVYKPQDFDENHPVYHMKIWDKDGNVTERTVNLNEIDPKHCNSFDMYAYSCYASDSGKCPNAMLDFMVAHAHYRGELGGGSSHEDLFKEADWLAVLKDIMDMQYRLGNLSGYIKGKEFFDFLENV